LERDYSLIVIFINESKCLYDKSLSAEQISAIYNNRTDLIVSQETTVGEEYICSVTPNDGFEDGITLNSSSLLVVWSTSQ